MPDDANSAVAAAQSFIAMLKTAHGLPPTHHSVYIHTEVDDDGRFKRSLRVHFHPKLKKKPKLPEKHLGFPVVQEPWPMDLL